MSLNNTPSSERIHIGIFGKRNAGKSSVINAITGQDLAIVSDIKGTTTDPVLKSMELLPLGPVVLIDTPGLDDEGKLGTLRIKKAYQNAKQNRYCCPCRGWQHRHDRRRRPDSYSNQRKKPYHMSLSSNKMT